MLKTRKVDNPYMIYSAGDWEWRILKSYQKDNTKPYARAFCAVKSPHTYGGYEYGDVYWSEIVANAMPVFVDNSLSEC